MVLAAVAALLCTTCLWISAQPSAEVSKSGAASRTSQFLSAPCAFVVPSGAWVQCGWLTVPENRLRSGGRNIRLHVAIYKSRTRPLPDPILWLVGGPGGRANLFASKLYDQVVKPYIAKRDFIVVDLRGSGYSQPALDCPNPSGPPVEWVPACRERLTSMADLDCYNSAAVAADLDDLRRALEIREWNLLGESYGTRYALSAVRDYPQGIRSVVLDSVVPPEIDEFADGPGKFEGALNALFADCAADPKCAVPFPVGHDRSLSNHLELD